MARETEYLYGDSTPSTLRIDFISLLRDAIDFAVEVLLHEAAAADAAEQASRASTRTDKDVERATELAAELSGLLQRNDLADGEGVTARCASRMREAIGEIVRTEGEIARAAVAAKATHASQSAAIARAASVKALEALLLRRRLPGAATTTIVEAAGDRYGAKLRGRTTYGLSWELELDVPTSHALAASIRIDRLCAHVEVGAPEAVGWMRKEVKLRPQRLDRLYLFELRVDGASTVVKLRATPTPAGAGFDVTFSADASRAEIVRVLPGGLAPDEPHVVEGAELAELGPLHDALVAMATELAEHPRSLLDARLDDAPVDELEAPRSMVERLFADLAPTTEEIAKRSLVPGELALKRVVGDNRREELFVSKSELRDKVRALPQPLWAVFDPLDLWDDAAPPSAAAPARPASPRGPDVPPPASSPGGSSSDRPAPVAPRAERPQPPGASNRRSPGGPESTGKWPVLQAALQK